MIAFEIEPFNLEINSTHPAVESLRLKYSDVTLEDWYIPYLLIAEENGLVF